jgi:hypothetical protein
METLIELNQHGAINFMSAAMCSVASLLCFRSDNNAGAAVCMFWCLFNVAAGVDLALR